LAASPEVFHGVKENVFLSNQLEYIFNFLKLGSGTEIQ
jgi:hypothetical protein